MKLAEHISLRGISLEAAADEIGDVSVSGLRKWLAGDRIPRPDQMRRIHEWSVGRVSPNDFILDHNATSERSDAGGEDAPAAASCHAKAEPADLQAVAR